MGAEVVQYDDGDHILGDKNLIEAISTDGDIVFNESSVVVGHLLEARKIHATYDLTTLCDISAENITVNGSLYAQGNIEANSLICRGSFICTGEVRVKKIDLGNYSVVDSIVSETLRSSGNLFVRQTSDTDSLFEIDGLVVAGEGILGTGNFQAKAAIAYEYFEFNGDNSSNVFEISLMKFSNPETSLTPSAPPASSIQEAITVFNSTLSSTISNWSKYEENELISSIKSITTEIPNLHGVDSIVDIIVELSYKKEITNFRDYLFILYAKNIFMDELACYETLEPVLNDMFDAATPNVMSMEFVSSGLSDFANALYILSKFYTFLPISVEDGADKIFASIGLRYQTVKRVWRDNNE